MPTPTAIFFYIEAIFQKYLGFFADINIAGKLNAISFNVFYAILILITSSWNVTKKHFIVNNGHSPYITFVRISLIKHNLRIHVSRSSSREIHCLSFFDSLTKSKISDFVDSIVYEGVFRFQITMNIIVIY